MEGQFYVSVKFPGPWKCHREVNEPMRVNQELLVFCHCISEILKNILSTHIWDVWEVTFQVNSFLSSVALEAGSLEWDTEATTDWRDFIGYVEMTLTYNCVLRLAWVEYCWWLKLIVSLVKNSSSLWGISLIKYKALWESLLSNESSAWAFSRHLFCKSEFKCICPLDQQFGAIFFHVFLVTASFR